MDMAKYHVGIDIGGTKVGLGLLEPDGRGRGVERHRNAPLYR